MGQARNRGNRDQRIAKALGLQEATITELREQLGLPVTAEYLGYAVHLEGPDEFLSEFSDTPLAVRKEWAKTPELALRFESLADAVEISQTCRGSIVVVLFDTGDQIVASNVTGLRVVE